MSKERFSHNIDATVAGTFGDLANQVGVKKYELLEAMIRTFAALPVRFQDALVSRRPGVAETALERLAGLDEDPAQRLQARQIVGHAAARRAKGERTPHPNEHESPGHKRSTPA